jgi:arsenate reductase
LEVYSAGIETHGVNPRAIATMTADGIDLSKHTSNKVEDYLHIPFDYILTVCDHAQENCPYIPSNTAVRVHRDFSDPSKLVSDQESEIEAAFVATREEIKTFTKEFLAEHLS